MDISIELFPAGNGDAILLDLGSDLILIDCGYVSTFRDHLKPRLSELHEVGRTLSKFIVTHIDADHIQGAIAFIKENGNADSPAVIEIEEIWFNSYRHLHFNDKEKGDFGGNPPGLAIPHGQASIEAEDEERLVSFSQGTGLGSLILKNGYVWNASFQGLAVMADEPLTIKLSSSTFLTLLGPTSAALETLGDSWYTYLKKIFNGKINEDVFFDDAFEMMLEEMRQAQLQEEELDEETLVSNQMDWVETNALDWLKEDNSPTNGSSIIFLLEHKNKKLLFLGDAIPGQVVSQLEKLHAKEGFPIHVDVLKVAHHGAWGNNSPDLIKMVRADHFLFSTNGLRHHHPHLPTLAWILKSHKEHNPKNLIFNYDQFDRLVEMEDSDAKASYNYDTTWPEKDDSGNEDDGYIRLTI